MLIIDNHFEMRRLMLSILSKLTIIKTSNFGRQCFNTLKDLMVAGEELEFLVMDILQKEVINKLEAQNSSLIPSSLLNGLQELVLKSG